jgi:large subunit ribosomal protein L25
MATKAIKHFRLRELARASPPPPILKPTLTSSTGSPFNFAKFDFSQPTRVAPESATNNLPKRANPFIPTKNPQTGRWAPPKYSLRQQADLVKKARASATLALLPPAPKTSAVHLAAISFAKAQPASKKPQPQAGPETNGSEERWSQPLEWVGEVKERKVPGAEIGNRLYAGKKRMFKGHKWERVAEKRASKRRMLMRDMAKRIQRYKQASTFSVSLPCPCVVSLQFLP